MDLRERSATTSRRHPWELARGAFVLDLLRDHGALPAGAPPRVLDIGAGDGWLGAAVAAAGADVVAVDPGYTDDDLVAVAAAKGVTAARACPAGPFDVALALDVIEHVDDDVGLLTGVAGRVRAGGVVVVTVPAWPVLFGHHDAALGHRRRYTPEQVRAVVAAAGLRVEESGGFFHALLVPRALAVAVRRLVARRSTTGATTTGATTTGPTTTGIGGWTRGARFTDAVVAALRLEQRASRRFAAARFGVPGLSCFVVARVPGDRA